MKRLILFSLLACLPAFASRQFQASTDTLLGGSPALPQSATLSVMVYPQFDPNDGQYHVLFEAADPGATTYFQLIQGPNILYAAWLSRPNFAQAIASNYTLPKNVWSNVLVTWANGGQIALFVDGAQIAVGNGVTWFSTAGFPWSLGNRATGTGSCKCDIAEFGLWSRVLTSNEIAPLGAGAFPSTVPSGLFAEYDLVGASLAAQAGTAGTLTNSGPVVGPDVPPPPPPALLLSGTASGMVGASAYFTVTETHLVNTTVITPSDGGAGGRFSPTTLTLTAGNRSTTLAYSPVVIGSIVISIANDQGLTNPPPLTYTVRPPPVLPILTVDAASKTVAHGKDVSFVITQTTANGYTGGPPDVRIENAPGSFTLSANGRDCGTANTAITYFNWRECGPTANGVYTLIVHTAALAPGVYYFTVVETGQPGSNGSGVSLTLTVT